MLIGMLKSERLKELTLSLLVYMVISGRRGWDNPEERKRGRRLSRCLSGIAMPGQYRFLTLTSGPGAPEDIEKSWRKFEKRLKRSGNSFDYVKVKERGVNTGMLHLHIVLRGGYIPIETINQAWGDLTGSFGYIERVQDGYVAAYLCKYMGKEALGRISYSRGWLWQGFATDWVLFKRIAMQADGLSYGEMIEKWREVLQQPEEVKNLLFSRARVVVMNQKGRKK